MIQMSTDKVSLKIIDNAINDVEQINIKLIEVLKAAKERLIQIQSERDKLEREKVQLEAEKDILQSEKSRLEQDKRKLEQETRKLEMEKLERDQKIGQMTEEQMRLLEEYKKVKEELKKFAKIAAEMEEQELDFDRIQALLSIYTVLLEKIFQGQPHFRILYTLHGAKETMSREELKNTTGIQGAMVLRAVQELDKVELVDYDMETNVTKLKKRLFPKPNPEKK